MVMNPSDLSPTRPCCRAMLHFLSLQPKSRVYGLRSAAYGGNLVEEGRDAQEKRHAQAYAIGAGTRRRIVLSAFDSRLGLQGIDLVPKFMTN